jgi:tetratricopeptide (TPR) repeat protein
MFASAIPRGRRIACLPLIACALSGSISYGQGGIFDDPLVTGESETGGDAGALDSNLLGDGAEAPTDPNAELDQMFTQANGLMQQQSWAEATELLTQYLSARPADPRAFLLRGMAYAQLDRVELAITDLTRATTLPYAGREPGLLEQAFIQLGKLKFDASNYREAVDDLMQARQYNASNAEVNYWLGKALLRQVVTQPGQGMDQAGQANLLQAVKSLKTAIDAQPNYGEAYLERGRVLFRLRLVDNAVEDLEKAVQIMGPTSEAAADLGIAYTVRATQETQQASPDDAKITSDLREGLTSLDSYLQNATLGEKIPPWETQDPLEQKPTKVLLARADARVALANEVDGGERQELLSLAIADADRLLTVDAGDEDLARAHYIRGVALRLSGNLDQAVQAFTQAIKIYDSFRVVYGEAYLRRGICFYYQAKYDQALQDFEAAANSNPSDPFSYEPHAMLWKGITEAQSGNFLSAIQSYTHAVNSSPRFSTAYYNRGLAYLNMGRYDQALEDFNVVLRQEPGNETAQRMRDIASRSN